MTNEQAIIVYALGDQNAFNYIYHNFQYLILKLSGEIYHTYRQNEFLDFDELLLAGQVGLRQAVETYQFGSVPFAAYAKVVIDRAISAVPRALDGPTRQMMNHAQSLDDFISNEEEGLRLCDVVGEYDFYHSDQYSSTMDDHLDHMLDIEITELEKQIIVSRFHGYSFEEILTRHNISRRKLNNILTSLRNNIKSS